MKISFDLDDTLIPARNDDFEIEDRTLIQKLFGIESLRKGTRKVFEELQGAGHLVGVYTTSHRSISRIRFQLWTYGVSTDFIVNEQLNRKKLLEIDRSSSKYPPAFHIDLHIDDSKGVQMEAQEHGFNVIIIAKDDYEWTYKVLKAVLSQQPESFGKPFNNCQ